MDLNAKYILCVIFVISILLGKYFVVLLDVFKNFVLVVSQKNWFLDAYCDFCFIFGIFMATSYSFKGFKKQFLKYFS